MTKKTTTTFTIAAFYFIGVFAVLLYAYIAVSAKRHEAITLRQTIAEQKSKQVTADMVETAMTNTAAERTELNSYFLAEKDTISFIANIETLATKVGVNLETTGLDVVKPADGRPELKTSFQVSGSKLAVLRFLTALETLPYHGRIPTLRLGSGDDKVWQAEVAVVTTMTP
jgi:hypothetical protein